METIILIGVLIAGVLLGYVGSRKQRGKTAGGEELKTLLADIGGTIDNAMIKAVGHLREQSQADLKLQQTSIEALVKPINDALEKSREQVREIEKERKHDQGALTQQLASVAQGQMHLQQETGRLVNALRKPQVRGRWGELTLRRTVELAGMEKHCDFEEQARTDEGTDQRLRPDLTVHLPNRRRVVVDAKTPLDAYLSALEKSDEEEHRQCLTRHAQQLASHVRNLASKAYWKQFEDTLDFVVMFIPGEQFLTAALEYAPTLQEDALNNRVILATPSTLVALLRAIAYGWRQKSLEENAQEIRHLGEELYMRTARFIEHLAKVGKHLDGSISAYNAAVGSLERSLLPGARKFAELGIQKKKEIPDIKPVEPAIREIAQKPGKASSPPLAENDGPPETPG